MLKVYLDQSAASRLIDKGSIARSDLYNGLLDLQSQTKIEVWASPHNAVELAIWSDRPRRQAVSLALEELTEGRRMLASHEFILLYEALGLINVAWPGASVRFEKFQSLAQDNQRLYSGLVAHMAALQEYDTSRGACEIIRTKRLSQLRQLRLLVSAKDCLELLINNPQLTAQTEPAFDACHENLPIEDIDQEIDTCRTKLKQVGKQKNIAQKLEKNRAQVVQRFMGSIAIPAIGVAIGGFHNLLELWDYSALVTEWDSPEEGIGSHMDCTALPDDLAGRFSSSSAKPDDYWALANLTLQRIVPLQWMPSIMLDFLSREMEKAFKTATEPTEGLTIDVDHISGLFYCDVLLTYDNKLKACVDTWLRNNSPRYGLPDRHCVGSLAALMRLAGNA